MAGLVTPKSTGSKRMGSAVSNGRSRTGSTPRRRYPCFAVCIRNRGCEASLRFGKVYQIITPRKGDLETDVRVIDEEGEDYLYGADRFAPVELNAPARRALMVAKYR